MSIDTGGSQGFPGGAKSETKILPIQVFALGQALPGAVSRLMVAIGGTEKSSLGGNSPFW